MEAQECMVMGRWLDLASLMLTSADLVFSKVSEKGTISNEKVNLFNSLVHGLCVLPKKVALRCMLKDMIQVVY